jgi:trimeric autotransporter adhesin
VKKIRKQTITKSKKINSIKDNKTKIIVPLLILSLVLVLSFSVNDVAAAQGTSNNTIVQSQNVTDTNPGQPVDTQTTVSSKSENNNSKTDNASNSLNVENNQTLSDPQIYHGGAPVARGGNPVGYIYSSIAAAITVANAGDTIMLENGATFQEHGLVINKDLNFDVFSNGHATIDGQNLGTIFIISNGVTVNLNNLILKNGNGNSGGAIFNNGILTVNNCTFTSNSAQNGGAIYNGGTVSYISTTRNSETVTLNGGTLTVNNSTFTGNTATQNGGAIYNSGTINVDASTLTSVTITKNGGTATISNSTFKSNSAQNGGAIFNGGTINITTSSTLTDSTVTNNGGTLTIDKSVFSGNTAANNGGSIANDATFNVVNSSTLTRTIITKNGGTVTVTSSILLDNNAINGGAISNVASLNTHTATTLTGPATSLNTGTVTVTDSTIMGNNASNNGGAIYNAALTNINTTTFTDYTINNDATISATFNTLAGNTAQNGGAVYNDAISTVTTNPSITRTTLANTATATTTDNALVDNIAQVGRDIVNNVVTTENNNVFVTSPTPANTGTVNAVRNWWGTVSGPLANDVVGTVAVNPFLIYSMNIAATASNSSPNVGQQFHYTITVTNNGPDTATDVQVIDGIPNGLTFNNSIASQGTYNHATEIWNIGTLASGASATLVLFVTPTASVADTTVTKNATLINTNQTASAIVSLPKAVDVVVSSTTSNSSPIVGQPFHYTITATNNGPDTATGVQVTDVIPAGLTFNGYTASQGTYDSTTGIWTVGTLANGASATLRLFVTPTASVAGTTVTNIATITAINEFNQNTSPFTTLSINVQNNGANNTGINANAATETIPMQHTGVPIAGLIVATLMVLGGTIIPKLKK